MIDANPLIATPPSEVPLTNAPLVRAIAQVRFPPILSIEQQAFVGAFQESIRAEYPTLEPVKTQSLILNTDGASVTPTIQTTWCFWNTDRTWRISLSSSSVSIETTKYTSRTDFLARLEDLLVKLHSNFHLSQIDRVGLRYIDRVVGQNLEDISQLIRPEMAGISCSDLQEYVHQVLHESLFLLPEAQISARWGVMPANATFDPYTIEAVSERSWILDLDISATNPQVFNLEALMAQALRFTERIYTFFRWAVTDEFLRRYGGEL
ncbi:TIGR04255 family protein [Chamaesiphon polymorphus CCALA 037]|uniref:TIGR04255 family protein n=1 Tax=Chamaesiphon polymorphus CCALA 037 TaxID=2107692 RepID=A0A2T1GN75_9CYAN|nr:TIGR04255 family protein [Chamaesiphon polymorphus CCALA 037]